MHSFEIECEITPKSGSPTATHQSTNFPDSNVTYTNLPLRFYQIYYNSG